MLNPPQILETHKHGSDPQMNEQYLFTAWSGDALTTLIITGLVVLNILVAWFAFNQKKHRSKLERDILAAETFSSASPLAAKRPVREFSESRINARDTLSENTSSLKIDQAIKMFQSGVSLEEIKSLLDIEVSYLQIIAAHHRG